MAEAYEFIGSEEVTVDLSPTETMQEQQVTARALPSGVVFYTRFDLVSYANAEQTAATITQLAERFNEWSAVQGVVGISSVEDIDNNNMLRLNTEIVVASTSGRSTQSFTWVYPVAEFNTVDPLISKVNQVRKVLDAVEAA